MMFRVPKSYPNILLFAVQNKIENTTVVYPRRAGLLSHSARRRGAPGKAKSWVCSRLHLRNATPERPSIRAASPVGLFGLVADDISSRGVFGKFARVVRFVARPISE